MTEAELLTAAAAGDERAFAQLVTPHKRAATLLAVKILRNREDAEDVWQDTQLRIFRNLHRIDPARSFKAYLMTITAHLAYNEIRRQRRHRHLVSFDEVEAERGSLDRCGELASPMRQPDDAHDDQVLFDSLEEAIAELSPVHRRTFVLRRDGYSYDEIAALMGENMGTVKSRLHRARAQLLGRVSA